ncbi:MAG: type II/IV secretion system protein [Gammaproteobacteria bacterium]|nr:type II/IV secretion system protein [Gammaproteobacteria bacterium]
MDFESLDALRFHTNMSVDSVMTTAADVAWAIDYHYESYGLGSDYMDQLVDSSPLVPEFESAADESSEIEDNIVVKLINKVIVDAHHQGASDIHIEPYKDGKKTIIRFRKDGTLIPYFELPGHYRNALVSRIKIMAGLDISERRKPQDGKIDYRKYGSLDIELRVATMPTVGRIEDIVIRVLSSGKPVPVNELDLSERNHDKIRKAIAKPYGLFLVCGPTGSGKTTTLHSILGDLNTDARKIWTVEDPVEITQEGLRQVQVNPRIGLTFAAAMRSFLRADPDVIMVGEMRDQETLAIGVEASLTGHLVLSTLHTNSAPDSIVRLLDMGMDPFNFADALLGILAQRLAKRLCLECREEHIASEDEIQALLREYRKEVKQCQNSQLSAEAVMSEWHSKFADRDGRYTLYKAVGCDTCDRTGYKGRIGIHEFLDATDVVKRCILEGQTVSELLAAGLEGDMRTLKQDGIEKVLQGYTDMVQVRIVCIK